MYPGIFFPKSHSLIGTKAVFSPLVMVADSLNEERMAGIEVDAVVGVLTSLGHDHPSLDAAVVETKGITDLQRPTDPP